MALKKHEAITPQDLVQRLLRERDDPRLMEQRRAELEARVAAFEARFGLPSDRIHEAIESGQLEETVEVCDWIFDYETLVRSKSSTGG